MSLRRVFTNPRMFRQIGVPVQRAYSTAGYGNVTTSAPQQNPDEPPLDIEDPQEVQASLHRAQPQETQQQQAAPQQQEDLKPQKDRRNPTQDKESKQKTKEFNKGSQDAMRDFSKGCD